MSKGVGAKVMAQIVTYLQTNSAICKLKANITQKQKTAQQKQQNQTKATTTTQHPRKKTATTTTTKQSINAHS